MLCCRRFGCRQAAYLPQPAVWPHPNRSSSVAVVRSISHKSLRHANRELRRVCCYFVDSVGSIRSPTRCSAAPQPGLELCRRAAALRTNRDLAPIMSYAEFVVFVSVWLPSGSISPQPVVRQPPNRSLSVASVWQHFAKIVTRCTRNFAVRRCDEVKLNLRIFQIGFSRSGVSDSSQLCETQGNLLAKSM